MRFIGFASVGIITFILLLLFSFIAKNFNQGRRLQIGKEYLILMTVSFLLTCGNIVRRLMAMIFSMNMDRLPATIFSLNMIHLLLMSFFVIGFVGASKSKKKIFFAFIMAGLFALAYGRMGLLAAWSVPLTAAMVLMAVGSIVYDMTRPSSSKTSWAIDWKPVRNLSFFITISVFLTAMVFFISGNPGIWEFGSKIVTSSLSSFGGGEAYIGVADAVFVQTGFITTEDYYGRIIGMSSAMPGPVLMSIAGGIGFAYGSMTGGVALGWAVGLLGIALAVGATALGALSLKTCFTIFKESQRLQLIIVYILPLVCGMLVSTALTLLRQSAAVLAREGVHPALSVGMVLALFFLMQLLRRKYKIQDVKLLLLSGAGTLLALGVYTL
jgi:chromate transporter